MHYPQQPSPAPAPRRQITLEAVCESLDDDIDGAAPRAAATPAPPRARAVTAPAYAPPLEDDAVLPGDPREEARYDRPARTAWGGGGSGGGRAGGGSGGGNDGGGAPLPQPSSASLLMFCVLLSILLPIWYFVHLVISRPEWVVERVSTAVRGGLAFGSRRLQLLRSMKSNRVATQRRAVYRTLVVKRHGSHIVARCVPAAVLCRRGAPS